MPSATAKQSSFVSRAGLLILDLMTTVGANPSETPRFKASVALSALAAGDVEAASQLCLGLIPPRVRGATSAIDREETASTMDPHVSKAVVAAATADSSGCDAGVAKLQSQLVCAALASLSLVNEGLPTHTHTPNLSFLPTPAALSTSCHLITIPPLFPTCHTQPAEPLGDLVDAWAKLDVKTSETIAVSTSHLLRAGMLDGPRVRTRRTMDAAVKLGIDYDELKVKGVTRNGQAEQAGIEPGWRIVAVDNEVVMTLDAFVKKWEAVKARGSQDKGGALPFELTLETTEPTLVSSGTASIQPECRSDHSDVDGMLAEDADVFSKELKLVSSRLEKHCVPRVMLLGTVTDPADKDMLDEYVDLSFSTKSPSSHRHLPTLLRLLRLLHPLRNLFHRYLRLHVAHCSSSGTPPAKTSRLPRRVRALLVSRTSTYSSPRYDAACS